MVKKAFFGERTDKEVRKLDQTIAHSTRGLVKKIIELEDNKALIITTQILPGKFYIGADNSSEAARKAYKHGEYMSLPQAGTLTETLKETRLPHEIRREAFEGMHDKREGDVQTQGYSFVPIQGRDRTKRIIPFAWLLEGARLFAYGMQTGTMEVKPYPKAGKVQQEGANVVVAVPSREQKKERYAIRFTGVPVIDNDHKHSIWTTMSTTYAEGKVPEHSLWSFSHKFKDDPEQSRAIIYYPHDIAGMLAIAEHFAKQDIPNRVPWDMNPFAKPSKKAVDFYRKLCNNVLIVDPRREGKIKTRQLYVSEKSILLGRLESQSQPDETFFWKAGRDPKRLQDYDWGIPGSN